MRKRKVDCAIELRVAAQDWLRRARKQTAVAASRIHLLSAANSRAQRPMSYIFPSCNCNTAVASRDRGLRNFVTVPPTPTTPFNELDNSYIETHVLLGTLIIAQIPGSIATSTGSSACKWQTRKRRQACAR
jgi:hypothetical protein